MDREKNNAIKLKENLIIKKIKERRLEMGLSYQDLSNRTQLSKSTLQRYETGGIRNLPLDKIEILASALNINPIVIMGWDKAENVSIKLPIYTIYSLKNPLGYKTIPQNWMKENEQFYLLAEGEHMTNNRVYENNLLLIEKINSFNDGDMGIFNINNKLMLLKVFNDNDNLILQSDKRNQTPIFTKNKNIEIIGKVKSIILD